MRLPLVDRAIAAWNSHQGTAKSLGVAASDLDELESYMVRSIILMIISEYEEYLEKVFAEWARRAGGAHLHSFMRAYCDKRFRSPDLEKIRGILKMLGGDYNHVFWEVLDRRQPRIKASWDNLMRARHAIVHKAGVVNLTWREMETAYADSLVVLDELVKAIGLTAEEAANLQA